MDKTGLCSAPCAACQTPACRLHRGLHEDQMGWQRPFLPRPRLTARMLIVTPHGTRVADERENEALCPPCWSHVTRCVTSPRTRLQGRYPFVTHSVSSGVNDDVELIGCSGSIGEQGIQGEQGPQGEQGIQGPQGATGPQGEGVGEEGPQGEQGDRGSAGPQGGRGPAGPQGERGPQGSEGPQGVTGARGPQGETGPRGLQGEVGPQGVTGARGPQGEVGPRGLQGEVGPQGERGEAGHANSVVVIPLPERFEVRGLEGIYVFTLVDAATDEPYYEVQPSSWRLFPPHMDNPIRNLTLNCAKGSWLGMNREENHSLCGWSGREQTARDIVGTIE